MRKHWGGINRSRTPVRIFGPILVNHAAASEFAGFYRTTFLAFVNLSAYDK
jgi:hypothetical protein